MSVGENALVGGNGYLAIARETTLGTYATCTAGIDFLSFKFATTKDRKILEQVVTKRYQSKSIGLGITTEGSLEYYFNPGNQAGIYVMANAFGGTVTSATVTAATSFTHTIDVGAMDGTYKSLSFNVRYGDATNGKVFQYTGIRVGDFSIKAELDDALMCSAEMIAMDSTSLANDVNTALTITSTNPLSFVSGRLSIDGSVSSLTASSFWHIQSMELKMSNNLKSDSDCRRIGSDKLQTIALGQSSAELTVNMRFDTLTAYSAMLAQTQFAGEFEFTGETITGSTLTNGLTIVMPKLYIKSAPEPEVSGPDEVLKTTVVFDVLRDDSSAGGYALQAVVQNGLTSL